MYYNFYGDFECSFCRRKANHVVKHVHGSGKLLCTDCNLILMKMLNDPAKLGAFASRKRASASTEGPDEVGFNEQTFKRRRVERPLDEQIFKLKNVVNALPQRLQTLISYEKSLHFNQQCNRLEAELDTLCEEVNQYSVYWSRYFSELDEYMTDVDIEAALTMACTFIIRMNSLNAELKSREFNLEKCPRIQDRPLQHFFDAIGNTKPLAFVSGDRLATCPNENSIRIWNVLEGNMSWFQLSFSYSVVTIEPLSRGWIAVSLSNGFRYQKIAIVDLNKKRTVRILEGHKNLIGLLKCLSNGLLVSFAGEDSIKIWNPYSDDGNLLLSISLDKSNLRITSFDSLPNGNLVALGNNSGIKSRSSDVMVWNARDGQPINAIKLSVEVTANMLVLSSGRVAFGFKNGRIMFKDLSDVNYMQVIYFAHRRGVFWLAQICGTFLLSGGSEFQGYNLVTQLKLWSLADLSLLQTVDTGFGQRTFSITISPSGRLLAWKDENESIKCWPIVF